MPLNHTPHLATRVRIRKDIERVINDDPAQVVTEGQRSAGIPFSQQYKEGDPRESYREYFLPPLTRAAPGNFEVSHHRELHQRAVYHTLLQVLQPRDHKNKGQNLSQ